MLRVLGNIVKDLGYMRTFCDIPDLLSSCPQVQFALVMHLGFSPGSVPKEQQQTVLPLPQIEC